MENFSTRSVVDLMEHLNAILIDTTRRGFLTILANFVDMIVYIILHIIVYSVHVS